jgi:tRNA (cmo5U34)-methyltransferase
LVTIFKEKDERGKNTSNKPLELSHDMVTQKLDHGVFDGSNYDKLIGGIIPHYQILLQTAVRYLPPGAKNILELGCGTGRLTGLIQEACPHAEITGIDLSAEMLDKARVKPLLKEVRFVTGDIRDSWPEPQYDAIISTLCLHHLTEREREDILKRASKVLEPNGRFICGDIFRSDHDQENQLIIESWRYSMAKEKIPDDAIAGMTAQYISNLSRISTMPLFRDQLTKAGFSCTFSPFSAGIAGLIIGFRSDKDPIFEGASPR